MPKIRIHIALAVLIPALALAQDSKQAATAAYEKKDYATCAAMFSRLGDKYSAACCYALGGNKDAAFKLLNELVAGGWANTQQFKTDIDFNGLHDDKRWSDVLAGSEANRVKMFGNDNRELWEIRQGDAAERSAEHDSDLKEAIERDHARLKRTKEIIAEGGLKTATDYYNAAMIHQHGSTADDYLEARALAQRAFEMDPANDRAKWLTAASLDRYLRRVGKPQIYGTQFKKVDGVWVLEPVDETAVTDADRAKLGVPSLAEQKKRAEEMNAKK
jgi:uncharacterized protein DUF6624